MCSITGVLPPQKTWNKNDDDLVNERIEELESSYLKQAEKTDAYKLPHGFFFNGDLLYYEPEAEDRPPIPICSRLEVTACTRDSQNRNHGRLLKFQDLDRFVHVIALPMELLAGDGLELRKLLLSHGLYISPHRGARQLLANYLLHCIPQQRVRCVSQVGWHGNQFVLPDETFGANDDEETILQTTTLNTHGYERLGSLIEWQTNVARLCAGNSRLVLALSLAFAAPLLNLLNMESGGFHIRGASSTGKTTALRVASSVWGGKDQLQRWRATANGLEAVAAWHNDTLLCLDELSQIAPEQAGEAAYMLANGSSKIRSDKNLQYKKHASWRLLFLSNGEMGLADHMLTAGHKVKAGQEVRVIDIKADVGEHGIFEELHGFASGATLADHLMAICGQYHGVASRQFLEKLVKGEEQVTHFVKESMKLFTLQLLPKDSNGQISRVLNRFALVAAGGELATKFGITEWNEGEASKMVAKCFSDWLSNRGLTSHEEKEALEQVRLFFQLHGDSRFARWEDSEEVSNRVLNRVGYKKKASMDESQSFDFYVFRDTFKKEICKGLDSSFVAKVCIKYGLLIPDSHNKATRSERLPGGLSIRCYRFNSKVMGD